MSLKSDGESKKLAIEAQSSSKKRRSKEDASVHLDREPVLKRPVLSTGIVAGESKESRNSEAKQEKPKKSFVYKYGNYRGYYGYRLDESGNDARMVQFEEAWFRDKKVLDIGCNAGVVAIRVSKSFGCRSMLGVDIDKSLIEHAKRNLEIEEFAVEPESTQSKPLVTKFHGGGKIARSSSSAPPAAAAAGDRDELDGSGTRRTIEFEHCNYLDRKIGAESLDTIMWYVATLFSHFSPFILRTSLSLTRNYMRTYLPSLISPSSLSVIKWIHLNWGDEGLRKLLRKVLSELKPGGIFILEIQPMSSYHKVKNLTKHIRTTYDANQIHPDQIVAEAETIGFALLKSITPPTPTTKKGGVGFARPIHVFIKPIIEANEAEKAT